MEKELRVKSNVFIWLICLFFFFSLIFPTDFQSERLPFLCLIVAMALFSYTMGKSNKIHASIIFWYLICLITSIFFVALGIYNNTPGAIPVMTVYVVWPALYIILMGISDKLNPYIYLIRTILYGTIVSSMMGIALLSEVYLGINFGMTRFAVESGWGVGIENGSVAYSLPNIGTVICGTSLAIGLIFSGVYWGNIRICSNKLCYMALFLGVLSGILSGRQALFLSLLLAPVVYFVLNKLAGLSFALKGSSIYILIILIISIAASAIIFEIDFSLFYKSILDGFSRSESDSFLWRYIQFNALIYEWGNSPIIGHGLGASSRLVIRSYEQPWAYELYYIALLFQTGIVGVTIYTSAVIWIFTKSVQIVRENPETRSLLFPLLVCLSSLLFANGTNPYLGKFDYLWVLFLPVGILNLLMQATSHDRYSDRKLELSGSAG